MPHTSQEMSLWILTEKGYVEGLHEGRPDLGEMRALQGLVGKENHLRRDDKVVLVARLDCSRMW